MQTSVSLPWSWGSQLSGWCVEWCVTYTMAWAGAPWSYIYKRDGQLWDIDGSCARHYAPEVALSSGQAMSYKYDEVVVGVWGWKMGVITLHYCMLFAVVVSR